MNTLKRFSIIVFTLFILSSTLTAAAPPDLYVWPLKECRRVLRSEEVPPIREGAVRLSLARNEWESFQLLFRLESGEAVTIEDIELEPFVHDKSGKTLNGQSLVYRQHQIYLDQETEAVPGWYPEPLIPAVHPLKGTPLRPTGKDMVYRAFPFTLPTGQTHGYLVDIYAPPAAESGIYRGKVKVKIGLKKSSSYFIFPVELEVYNFTLPETASMNSWFWQPERQMRALDYSRSKLLEEEDKKERARLERAYYSFEDDDYDYLEGDFDDNFTYWQEISDQVNELVRRHGITVSPPLYSFYLHREKLDDRDYAFSPADLIIASPHIKEKSVVSYLANFIKKYKINTMELPFSGMPTIEQVVEAERSYLWGFPKATLPEELESSDFDDFFKKGRGEPDELLTGLKNYLLSLDRLAAEIKAAGGEGVDFFIYLYDEPGRDEHYDYIAAVGGFINRLSLKNIEVMVVGDPWGNSAFESAGEAVDIWTISFRKLQGDYLKQLKERAKKGERYWSYTALKHGNNPQWIIDSPAVSYRAPLWLNWQTGASGLLYWSMALWGWNGKLADPWTEQVSFVNSGRKFNGEGRLLYPAYRKTVGYKGVVPTFSLKSLRDGLEDYEYLALLERERKSLVSKVEKEIITPLTPSWTGWSPEPYLYELARESLAGALLYGQLLSLEPATVPGRVEAEDYSSCRDNSVGNSGGLYRAGDGDIYYSKEAGSHVVNMEIGESLSYRIKSPGPFKGVFKAALRGLESEIMLEIVLKDSAGKTVSTNTINRTGPVMTNIEFPASASELVITLLRGSCELDWIVIEGAISR